ncbi:hypothetical protein BH18ACT9_BH18ACT9_04830 [soil metagenome]
MFRNATRDDLTALGDLERDANLAALSHVFPAERFPFPDDAVLARWALVLDEPGCAVLVADTPSGRHPELMVFIAYDDTTLRHLAVHPNHWGQGIATSAIGVALHAMELRGGTKAFLWCLVENHRARRLYEHLGWQPTEERGEASWPPYPVEMRYTRRIAASGR